MGGAGDARKRRLFFQNTVLVGFFHGIVCLEAGLLTSLSVSFSLSLSHSLCSCFPLAIICIPLLPDAPVAIQVPLTSIIRDHKHHSPCFSHLCHLALFITVCRENQLLRCCFLFTSFSNKHIVSINSSLCPSDSLTFPCLSLRPYSFSTHLLFILR